MEDLILFLGRFHVVALHLPISILALLAGLEIYFSFSPRERPSVLGSIWFLGLLAAVITSGLGYLLSLSGGYNEDAVNLHLIWGVATTFIALIGWVAFSLIARRGKAWSLVIGGVQLATLSVAGHLGGNLTHGPEFLFEYAPNSVRGLAGFDAKQAPRAPVSDLADADIFVDVIHPLLELRCVTCHNPSKTKGGLLLDTYDNILLGGDSGLAIVARDLSASELSVRINLDPAHDDYMPSGGKTPFTPAQAQVIDWWILSGAPPSGSLAALNIEPDTLALIADAIDIQVTVSNLNELGLPFLPKLPLAVIMELENLGFDATPISEKTAYLDIDFYRLGEDSISEEHVTALLRARDHIAQLNLGNSGLQDHHLSVIAQLPNLLKLDISKNPISNEGIRHLRALDQLEILNLHATQITDEVLPLLDKLPNLERAFVWSTAVNLDATIDRPYLQIESGFTTPIPQDEKPTPAPQPER